MSVRSSGLPLQLGACVALLLLSAGAVHAGTVTVTSYDMYNGNGVLAYAPVNYFDGGYTGGSGNKTLPGNSSNIPTSANLDPAAYLSGGKGILADGVKSTGYLDINYNQYVGWKYQDPTITFHLAGGSLVNSIQIYVSTPQQTPGSEAGGLVGPPTSVNLSVTDASNKTTSINALYSIASWGTANSVITLSGFGLLSSTDIFSLTLNRGPMLDDAIAYYNNHIAGMVGSDWKEWKCVDFCDPTSGFKEQASDVNKEPWILVSEVTFTSPVPEPSTWVMMISGFLGLGFVALRRRRNLIAT